MPARLHLTLSLLLAALAHAQPATMPSDDAPATQPAATTKPAVDPTPTALEGNWTLVSADYMGEKMPAEEVEGKKVVFKGNQMIMVDKGQDMAAATEDAGMITLDESADPKSITMADADDPAATFKGIYKLENGELTIVMSSPGGERPKAFDAQNTLKIVLKKA
jgi:uncharacterized protein (TIGR03067 family)